MNMDRSAFEKWMTEDLKCAVGSPDPYPAGIERDMWRCWQAATNSRIEGLEIERDLYREGCRQALSALGGASAFIRGIYKAETVEELTPEAMNETEVAVGRALDCLRSLNL